MIISYRFYRTKISHSNLNSHRYICTQLTTPSNYMTKPSFFSLLLPRKKLTPYHYWLDNNVNTFSFQFNFLKPSIYDLKTDEDDPSFLPSSQKATHHNPYITFRKHQKPKNYIFVNYKYTSPYTMKHLTTIEHSRITVICETTTL